MKIIKRTQAERDAAHAKAQSYSAQIAEKAVASIIRRNEENDEYRLKLRDYSGKLGIRSANWDNLDIYGVSRSGAAYVEKHRESTTAQRNSSAAEFYKKRIQEISAPHIQARVNNGENIAAVTRDEQYKAAIKIRDAITKDFYPKDRLKEKPLPALPGKL